MTGKQRVYNEYKKLVERRRMFESKIKHLYVEGLISEQVYKEVTEQQEIDEEIMNFTYKEATHSNFLRLHIYLRETIEGLKLVIESTVEVTVTEQPAKVTDPRVNEYGVCYNEENKLGFYAKVKFEVDSLVCSMAIIKHFGEDEEYEKGSVSIWSESEQKWINIGLDEELEEDYFYYLLKSPIKYVLEGIEKAMLVEISNKMGEFLEKKGEI
jgi:hypothetical protein